MAVRKARSARKRKRKIKIKETAEIRKKGTTKQQEFGDSIKKDTALPRSNAAIFKIRIRRKK